eukprot:1050627-Prymnesium_polylepis.1
MGNHKDQFRGGSIVDSPSKVIGVSGPMTVWPARQSSVPDDHGKPRGEEIVRKEQHPERTLPIRAPLPRKVVT